jgi:DNA mismatch repair protein MutH
MAAPARRSPPRDVDDLRARAEGIAGRTLAELAWGLGFAMSADRVRTKGKAGELIERALGASGGSAAVHDFPDLGVELKTIPIDARGTPRESTYVCTLAVAEADAAEWSTSWVRAKLAHVLWVPIVMPRDANEGEARVGTPLVWRPTRDQEAQLGADFDDLVGTIGIGGIESITARAGRWLQVRPKARDGKARTIAFGPDGERIATVPRGFYLRTLFTGAILRDPAATP